jgi:hypothetical protein
MGGYTAKTSVDIVCGDNGEQDSSKRTMFWVSRNTAVPASGLRPLLSAFS